MQTGFVIADDKAFKAQFDNDEFTRAEFLSGLDFADHKIKDVDGNTASLSEGDLYFFSTDEQKDGSRKTGYQTIELDDDSYQFYFDSKTGKATTGYVSKIKKFTANGLVLKATDDDNSNYVGVYATGKKGDLNSTKVENNKDTVGTVLLNKSGTVVGKKTKLRDENDHYYVVDDNGFVMLYFDSEEDYDEVFKDTYYDPDNDTEKASKVTVADYLAGKFNLDGIYTKESYTGTDKKTHYRFARKDVSKYYTGYTAYTNLDGIGTEPSDD